MNETVEEVEATMFPEHAKAQEELITLRARVTELEEACVALGRASDVAVSCHTAALLASEKLVEQLRQGRIDKISGIRELVEERRSAQDSAATKGWAEALATEAACVWFLGLLDICGED